MVACTRILINLLMLDLNKSPHFAQLVAETMTVNWSWFCFQIPVNWSQTVQISPFFNLFRIVGQRVTSMLLSFLWSLYVDNT